MIVDVRITYGDEDVEPDVQVYIIEFDGDKQALSGAIEAAVREATNAISGGRDK